MKKIKITNLANVNEAISQAEGCARERLISASDVTATVAAAEKKLLSMEIPKKAWAGTTVYVSHVLNLPSAYRWTAQYTVARVERTTTGWFLTHVERVAGNRSRGDALVLSESARAAIPAEFRI